MPPNLLHYLNTSSLFSAYCVNFWKNYHRIQRSTSGIFHKQNFVLFSSYSTLHSKLHNDPPLLYHPQPSCRRNFTSLIKLSKQLSTASSNLATIHDVVRFPILVTILRSFQTEQSMHQVFQRDHAQEFPEHSSEFQRDSLNILFQSGIFSNLLTLILKVQ